MSELKEVLEAKGVDASLIEERVRNRSRSKSLKELKAPRPRQDSSDEGDMVDEDNQHDRRGKRKANERLRSLSRSRSKGYRRELTTAEIRGKK